MNPEIKEKLKNILTEVLKTKPLSLFVVIKREDANLWDLVMSGSNLDSQENLNEIIKIINKNLERNEVVLLSKLVLLNSSDPFVKNFNNAFSVDGGDMEILNAQINNVFIKQAFLFYSK
jgi:hypothetical protein